MKKVYVLIGWFTIRETQVTIELHREWYKPWGAKHDAGYIVDFGPLTIATDIGKGYSRKGWSFLSTEAIDYDFHLN